MVVRAPDADLVLECNGAPMAPLEPGAGDAGGAGGPHEHLLLLGKRYELESAGVEVLCSKAGAGPLTIGGEVLTEKGAKALPSSD